MIDGELSQEESSRVMEAINQSPELQSFYEAAKQSTSSLQSYFGSEEVKDANVRLKEFIDSRTKENLEEKIPNKSKSVLTKFTDYIAAAANVSIKFMFKYFFLAPLGVGAAASLIIIVWEITTMENEPDFGLTAPAISNSKFLDESKDFVIFQFRSATATPDIENELEKIVENLIENRITTATITIDDVTIELKLLKYDGSCYFGDISQDMGEIEKFKYCLIYHEYGEDYWRLKFKSRKNFIQKMLNGE